MTRQTSAPIERLQLSDSYRQARELVRMIADGMMALDAPYQRGSVWSDDQRIALIQSWLSGTPIPSIIINDRLTPRWIDANGTHPAAAGEPCYAVIDGKQRLETAVLWYTDRLAVPASWFPSSDVLGVQDTDDGEYVTFSGLDRPAQLDFSMKALLPVAEAKVATVEAESAIYLRVKGAGTPQTEDDMARARKVAGQ